jgi:predicted Zn-dependent peptidase
MAWLLRGLAFLVLLAGAGAEAGAAEAPAERPPEIPFEKYVLPNGLRVILHQDHSSPLVAVNLWYYVGSKDERAGRTGFAHLFEHLMFMGSKHAPYPSFDAILEAWGGNNNASTSNDRTNYFEIGPSNLLETFLWLEADRMATLAEEITDEALGKQRLVVQNERRQSSENRPYGKVQLLLPELLYPPGHPYHWPVIGSHADLEAARVDDVKDFFRRFYVPANASLVIAGDFDAAGAKRLVDRYFAWQPRRPVPAPPAPKPVVLTADVRRDLEDKVQLARLDVNWHSPASFAPGDAELDVAAQILGGGKSSRLYRSLVYDKRLAQSAQAGQSSNQLDGRFRVTVTAKPGKTLEESERAAGEEVARLAAQPPTAEEVERARNKILFDLYREIDSLDGRADMLNRYENQLGDPGGLAKDIARYRAVTPEGVSKTLAQVVAGKKVVIRTFPEKKPAEKKPAAESKPPAAPAPGSASAPSAASPPGSSPAPAAAPARGSTPAAAPAAKKEAKP